MAVVYQARDLQHGRDVAIKVVRPQLAVGLGTERFPPRNSHRSRTPTHAPLSLYDSGSADGLSIAGESLRDRLRRERQLRLFDALQIAYEVADALGSRST